MTMPWKLYLESLLPWLALPFQGEAGIRRVGHRAYVGGNWDTMGELQLSMLKSMGLQRTHYLLDIGCGALRLGVRAIPFLDPGHYLGVEKERRLVEAGLAKEVDRGTLRDKRPEIIISKDFEFERLSHAPDFAIAQSLFTHLTAERIHLCFAHLRPRVKASSVLLATFFEATGNWRNPGRSHDRGYFAYSRQQMLSFGSDHGFDPDYIGSWNHPRGQVLVRYRVPARTK